MDVFLAQPGLQGLLKPDQTQDPRDRQQVRRARPMMKTMQRPRATGKRSRSMKLPTSSPPRVPERAPLALGAPMPLEPLPWKTWAENGMLLLTLSITRLAGR
jgi:hypothetical protein